MKLGGPIPRAEGIGWHIVLEGTVEYIGRILLQEWLKKKKGW